VRLAPGLLALALGFALAGCGGGKSDELSKATSEGPIGKGSSGVWLYRPAGKPKNVVVYFHGQGGPKEATPENHLPWINHLVKRGSIVVYPRYEMAYEADPMQYIVDGVKAAERKVDVKGLPVLAIGYSYVATPFWTPLFLVAGAGCLAFAVWGFLLAAKLDREEAPVSGSFARV